jgi:hypothetical protein
MRLARSYTRRVPTKVTFALVGTPPQLPSSVTEEEWSKSWDERRKVTLDVEDAETLASAIDRAARDLGIPPDEYFRSRYTMVDLALREADDRPRIRALVVLNNQGEAMWNAWDLRLISYGEFARAVEAGALPGDPRQLYLIWHQKGGNGVIPDWPDLIEGLDIAWDVVKALGVVGGAYYTVKVMAVDPLRKRLERGRDAIARNAPSWALRGAAPYSVDALLSDRGWSSESLAALLGCSVEDAEATLETFGFTFDEATGEWRPGGDDAAQLLRVIHHEVSYGLHSDAPDSLRTQYRRRIEILLQTGSVPPATEYTDAMAYDWEAQERREQLRKGLTRAAIGAAGFVAGLLFRRRR